MKNKLHFAILMVLAAVFAGTALFAADGAPAAAVTAPIAAASPAVIGPADAVPALVAPDWVATIVEYVKTIPTVGPIVTSLLELVAVLGTVFTMLTVFLTGVFKTLATLSRFANLLPLAEKIQAFHDKVWPYVAYLSIFNVQKKKS